MHIQTYTRSIALPRSLKWCVNTIKSPIVCDCRETHILPSACDLCAGTCNRSAVRNDRSLGRQARNRSGDSRRHDWLVVSSAVACCPRRSALSSVKRCGGPRRSWLPLSDYFICQSTNTWKSQRIKKAMAPRFSNYQLTVHVYLSFSSTDLRKL